MNKFQRLFCDSKKCCWCGACKNICPTNSIFFEKDYFGNQVFINTETCINCGMCKNVCRVYNNGVFSEPLFWKEGWSLDNNLREKSSSGGLAKSIAINCFEKGWKVFMCVAQEKSFCYLEIKEKADILEIAGSFYVKSSMDLVFKTIKKYLSEKEKVLFIGLPCHIASIKCFLFNVPKDNLYTVDIICHGTPSINLFDKYAHERKITDYRNISFRQKHKNSYKPLKFDYWIIPFLDGLTYTSNCYYCEFAGAKRISDITLGDSWGTNFGEEEKNNGISLLLMNTKKASELIPVSNVFIVDADKEKSIMMQGQLKAPSNCPKTRGIFIEKIRKKNSYHKSIKSVYKRKILISRFRNNALIYYIYRRIKPPKSSSYICFSVEKKNN